MIKEIKLKNFGPLTSINWSNLGKINLIIGDNGSGKTFLLKSIYCSLRTLEGFKRGNEQRTASEILADKLYWTFQAAKIGDLVSKGNDGLLSNYMNLDDGVFRYGFGRDTTKQISDFENSVFPRKTNSVFLPAKEVLSLYSVIIDSREQDRLFGFDDTYYDLARALRVPPARNNDKNLQDILMIIEKVLENNKNKDIVNVFTNGKKELQKKVSRLESPIEYLFDGNDCDFSYSREILEKIFEGRIEYFDEQDQWLFLKGRNKFPMGVTAEGVKKISILDVLLSNKYLNNKSVVLIDEPESALHPKAIHQFLDAITILADQGIQFFMASHSYFVVKKLFLIAQERGWSIPVISATDTGWVCDDLKNGMPDNPIIAESIRLYQQEVELALK